MTGVLPLLEVCGLLAGRRLVSMPYATGGGVLARTDAARRALLHAAEQLAHGTGACLLELRGPGQERSGWTSVDRYVEFVRDLPVNAADVERMLPRKARAAARQARDREGLTIRHDARDLNTVWNLYARSMRRLGSINYPRAFFADLGAGLGERMWVTTAWRGCRPVAGVVSFAERDTIRPYISGLDERLRCTGCANLLYLAVMERAAACGMKRFDFGRTRRDNAGAMEFKRNQGFEPRDLTYAHYTPPGRKPLDLTPTNPRLASLRRVWPRLPLAITRPLGAWLARSIPG
ncbi:MAG: GNAT family N-acetyltransferase [Planctomycetes bacterium]|nr:GNAT family N-acetyltransferase [Planctomycetota bacterium]